MPFSLVPYQLFEEYEQITPEFLRSRGVKLLICDLDYTLAPKSVRQPDQGLRDWVAALRYAGVSLFVISNNRSPKRVQEFCSDLGVPYWGHAGKPSRRGVRYAMKSVGVQREQTAMLGDKLLTDILAANRAGVLALMVEPRGGAVTVLQKVIHWLQRPFKGLCRRKMLKKY